jgi:antitoxin PrlF
MRITQKGQVTIPQDVRNQLGLLPYTEVEFEIADDHARIRKAAQSGPRGQNAVKALWGTAETRMTTDQIMALTRGGSTRGAGRRAKR